MILHFASLVAIVVLFTVAADQVAVGDETTACCGRRILVPASRFTVLSIRRMYESFRISCPTAAVSQLEVLIAGKAAESYLKTLDFPLIEGAGMSTLDFREMQRSRLGIAEVIDIGGNTVLRMHEESGSVRRIVLRGADPLRIQIGDDTIQIVFVAIDDWSVHGPVEKWVKFFVVYHGPLTVEHLSSLSRSMQRRIGFRKGTILFRADRWFFDQRLYPPFNPYFPTPDKEPNWNDVIVSDTGHCVLDNGVLLGCSVHSSEINPIKLPAQPKLEFLPPASMLDILRQQ